MMAHISQQIIGDWSAESQADFDKMLRKIDFAVGVFAALVGEREGYEVGVELRITKKGDRPSGKDRKAVRR